MISQKQILIVEDNPEILNYLSDELGKTYNVWEAKHGGEALEVIKEQEIDLILTDVMMPVMSGIDATKAIRSLNRPDAKTLPIIAMTANAFYEDAQKCLAAGMNAHLAKPLQIKKVKQTIAEWVKNNRSAKKDA